MSETGWHRHDSGAIHRDSDSCTWLGNPVPCDPPADDYAAIRFPSGARLAVGGAHMHAGECSDECY